MRRAETILRQPGTKIDIPLKEYCDLLRLKYKPDKEVSLIQIPQFLFSSFNKDVAKKKGYYAFPPTGLQCLYGALRKRGVEAKILDANFQILKKVHEEPAFDHTRWLDIVKEHLDTYNPSVIGVSCMFDSGICALIELLEFLKKRGRSIVIAGGVISTYEWENLLSRGLCHFVACREGEDRINYIFDHLTGKNMENAPIDGIYFNNNERNCESVGEEAPVTLKDDLIDSYSQVPVQEYYRYGSLNPFSRMAGVDDAPFTAIQFGRGCRGDCTFCSVHAFMGRGVRRREVDAVLGEMEYLVTERGIRHFEWLDDDLLFFKKDFLLLLKKIIEKGWKITWSANNGLIATSLDRETMSLMRDSGCIGFKVGIETGNEEMLKIVKKPATLDIFRKASALCEAYPEIFVGGNFMLGLPGERFRQMVDSFKFHLELKLDWAAFTICQPIRGATAFADFEDYFKTQMDSGGNNVKNFIPSRESSDGHLTAGTDILKGMDIFKIKADFIPSKEQVKEIWFTFNLVGNYIFNKNLRPEGRVNKFISWVEMAQIAYPSNPYMSLFLSFAYTIKGDLKKAEEKYEKALSSCSDSYWRERFSQFGLDEVLNKFHKDKAGAFYAVDKLRARCSVTGGVLCQKKLTSH